MSTRSRIGVENMDGSITHVYCHFDGYISGVGKMLAEHYSSEERARALIALGDLSSVSELLEPPTGVERSFNKPTKRITVAYHRDRNDDLAIESSPSRDAYLEYADKTNGEYAYLWADGKWLVSTGPYEKTPFLELVPAAVAEKMED